MTRILPLLCILFITSGCASLFGTRIENITVNTNEPATVVINNDTIKNTREANFRVRRNPMNLKVEVYNTREKKTLSVDAGKNAVYWLNANPYPTFFLGFLIDLNTDKKYSYPRNLYVDMNEEGNLYTAYDPWPSKDKWNLHVTFPAANLFYYKPDLGTRATRTFGIGGMNIGVDHYHKPYQFINYSIGLNTNYFHL